MKKHLRILAVSLALLSVVSIMPQARAAAPEDSQTVSTDTGRRQKVRVYYRMHNGKKQYRVWSITEGKWLSDWTDCD